MDQLLAAFPKELRFVYKQMPLVQIHQNAMNASKAAVAASRQGKYWEMHDELFKIYSNLSMDEIKKVAEKLGLDMKKFEADMNSDAVKKQVDDELALGQKVDVRGTPSFFVNGKVAQNRSVEGFKAQIDEALKAKKG